MSGGCQKQGGCNCHIQDTVEGFGVATFDVYSDTSLEELMELFLRKMESVLPLEGKMYTEDKIVVTIKYTPQDK